MKPTTVSSNKLVKMSMAPKTKDDGNPKYRERYRPTLASNDLTLAHILFCFVGQPDKLNTIGCVSRSGGVLDGLLL